MVVPDARDARAILRARLVMDNERFVTLALTNLCNLSCSYCYEEHKNSGLMTFHIAKSIIDKELTNNSFNKINFSLFGGEPFINFQLIREITEYIESISVKPNITLNVTTNGTLVHGLIQDWLIEHKNTISCTISLDGTRDMHNINRDNSFDAIDLAFFAKTYPRQPIKMTISPETLPKLYEGVVFCHNLGFEVFCNLAYGINWSEQGNIQLLNEQLSKLIGYYIDNPHIKACSILSDSFSQIAYEYKEGGSKIWCSVGIDMAAYDTDGEKYPCQMFMPLSCGVEKSSKAKELVFVEMIPDTFLDSKCQNCVFKLACPTCYGSNYIENGNIYQKDENYCFLMKQVLFARSYFMAKKWELGQLALSEEEEAALLKSIMIIQNAFA